MRSAEIASVGQQFGHVLAATTANIIASSV
jgi:hypothetical protein